LEQYFFAYLRQLAVERGGGEMKLVVAYRACQFLFKVSLTRIMALSHGESCAGCSASLRIFLASFGDVVAKLTKYKHELSNGEAIFGQGRFHCHY
jgi:hypothetical protein